MRYIAKWIRWTTILSVVTLSAGCVIVSGDYCSIAKPIWWETQSELDATPDGIVRQVHAHNEVWQAVCE